MENLSIGSRIKQRRKELCLTQMQIKQAIDGAAHESLSATAPSSF